MSVSGKSGSAVNVQLPDEWENQLDQEVRDNIHQTAQRVENSFIESGFESNLESVRVKDTGNTSGKYLGRSDEDSDQAIMDIASDNSDRERVPEDAQDETFGHELGHDYFRSIVSQLGEDEENNDFEELWQEQPSVFMTLNEAFADLTALTYSKQDSRAIERNPFEEGYESSFKGLEMAFSLDNRERELEILEGIGEDVEEGDYNAIKQKVDKLEDLTPDVDYRGPHVVGKQYNVFLVGMEDFFSTQFDECTAVNENQIGRFADYVDESGSVNPRDLIKHTHGSYDDSEVIDKTKEVLGIENDRRVNKGSIERPEEDVEEYSDEILGELIQDRLEPTIDKVREQIDTVSSEDVGEHVLNNLDYDKYGSADGRVNEDMDLPHEVGGVLAEALYEKDITPIDIARNPTKYAEITREAIEETIKYGVETARDETDQEFGAKISEEYRDNLKSLI